MGLGGGLLLFAVLAGALLGSALLGHAGQVSTETEFGTVSNDERNRPREAPRPGVSKTQTVFQSRLPEKAQPEAGALGYLRLLEYLPARPPAIGAVSSPFGTRVAPHRGFSYAARYHQSRFGREEFHPESEIEIEKFP
jgi:hypothetical protein